MGPVSFERIGVGLSRSELLAVASVLADAGIRATLIDSADVGTNNRTAGGTSDGDQAALVVGSVDLVAARQVIATLDSGQDADRDCL